MNRGLLGRVAAQRRCAAIAAAALSVLLLAGCTATPPTITSATAGSSAAAGPTTHAGPTTSAGPVATAGRTAGIEPEALIRTAVAKLNAAAGSVAAQQRVLATLVAPGQRAAQDSCPVATSTLTLEPVYADLAPAPDWRPGSGEFVGTVYSLPTLIRIHRDGRIVGTDLAELHAALADGGVGLTVLCVA